MSNVTGTVRAKIVTATSPNIYNLSMPIAGTEYSQALSNGTKKILVRARNRSQLRIAFISGDTSTTWITVEPGAVYFEENLDLNNVIIYLQSTAASQITEILEWV